MGKLCEHNGKYRLSGNCDGCLGNIKLYVYQWFTLLPISIAAFDCIIMNILMLKFE